MIKVIEVFGGIGSIHKALSNIKKYHNALNYKVIDMVEHNKTAVKAYNAIHNTKFEPQDILTWDKKIKCDYLHASPPCVSFSNQGKRLGASDEKNGSILWDALFKMIESTSPKFITIENVKGMLNKKNIDFYYEVVYKLIKLGYTVDKVLLNSKDFGIPQNRERLFICAWKGDDTFYKDWGLWGDKTMREFGINIEDYECEEATAKDFFTKDNYIYFINRLKQYHSNVIEFDTKAWENRNKNRGSIIKIASLKEVKFNSAKSFHSLDGISKCLRASPDNTHEGKIMDVSYNSDKSFHSLDGISGTLLSTSPDFKQKIMDLCDGVVIKYRKLSPWEVLKLMGFDRKDYEACIKAGVSPAQVCKLAGNSIVVNVMENLIEQLLRLEIILN